MVREAGQPRKFARWETDKIEEMAYTNRIHLAM